jgi:surface antigen
MDEGDRGCMGHSLELARDGRPVGWVNSQSGRRYVVTPVGPWREGGPTCRLFKLRIAAQGRVSNETGRACRSGDGVWQFR